ncbi:MAG: ferric reductase-like transmembrane domain-containing protein [Candidatus Synoicihabitans palmerolidicus]|nr:ferric reductase-like transmembrane domain-containing protein [Candidatus Synoicihabitans palmerolidicus]
MSQGYQAVTWTKFKRRYDWLLVLLVVAFLLVFAGVTFVSHPTANPVQVLMRAFGLAAITLLHVILALGPLARLNPCYLPLLYNRRHLGVMMFALAFIHGGITVFWYHALGTLNPILSVFLSDWGTHPGAFPFQAFGALALMILFVMAATSHDFWLTNLTAPIWKTLHMLVYLAYPLLLIHVAFGVLQAETSPFYIGLLSAGAITLITLHLRAGFREGLADIPVRVSPVEDGFIPVAQVTDLPLNQAHALCVSGERVALLQYVEDDVEKISALSGVCQHQNGPLTESKFVYGCLTCPWHGYQYQPDTGASPPPFTEKVPTFSVRVVEGQVFVHPRPNPAGTRAEPVILS